ncbi:RidA family protein [Amycolatopsis echigonensis]|nr:RidA family protein [Amycolatopsis echigonensis]
MAQVRQIAQNLDTALAVVGCGRQDIVKETVYVVDYRPELIPRLFGPLREGAPAAPASTLVGVAALFAPGVLVEVDVIAKMPGP